MANLLKVGALFKSYEEFEQALDSYSKFKNVFFRKVSSNTVAKANQALPANEKYDECLVYRNLTLMCKSGGFVRESESKGIRPNQRTLNIRCPGQISVCAQTAPQRLRVTKLIDSHNHSTTADFVKFYPEKRRLTNAADIAQVSGMITCRGQAMDIRDHVRTNLNVCMTSKDLANFREKLLSGQRKGSSDEQDVVNELRSLLEKDPGSVVGIVTAEPPPSQTPDDPDGDKQVQPLLDILFFQTSAMRTIFLKYGEILGMDTTYNTNKHNMHLIVFIVYDNHKNGRVVGYCFVRRETKDIVECAVLNFVEANPEAVSKVVTVLVDKDYREVSSINKWLPHAHVHLCNVHVLRVFDRETKKKCPENSSQVMSVLKKIIKSGSPEEFQETYVELSSVASPEFMDYFDRNWKDCECAWVLHVRNECLSLGVDNTNFVETHNGKIKRVNNRCKTLGDAVRGLLLLHRNRECESSFKDFQEQATRSYVANDKDPDIKFVLSHFSSWGAKLLISEIRQSKSLPEEYEFDVGDSCSCNFEKMFRMHHCRHVFHLRRVNGEPLVNVDEVPPRWHKGYNDSAPGPVSLSMQALLNQTPAPPKPKDKDQRYRECLKLCTEISDLVSQTGGRQNALRTEVLKDVIRHWLSGKEVIVLPLNSDGTFVMDAQPGNSMSVQDDQSCGISVCDMGSPAEVDDRNISQEEDGARNPSEPEDVGPLCSDMPMDFVCPHCNGPAPRKVSMRKGANFLRYYYSCAARCRTKFSFFRWLKCHECDSNNVREGHFLQPVESDAAALCSSIVNEENVEKGSSTLSEDDAAACSVINDCGSQNDSFSSIISTTNEQAGSPLDKYSGGTRSLEHDECEIGSNRSSDSEHISDGSENYSAQSTAIPFKLPQRNPSGADSKKKNLSEDKCAERRSRAALIPDSHVIGTAPGIWTVKSQTQGSLQYTVVLKADRCTLSACAFREPPCPHMFYCTCEDFKRWKGPCKHVFKVYCIREESTEGAPAPQRMSLLNSEDSTNSGFSLPVNKVHGRPRTLYNGSKKLGLKSTVCAVCKEGVRNVSSTCIVCKLKMHSTTNCSLPDPSQCKDGKANECVRVCRNCICPTCRLPKLASHSCLCVVCHNEDAHAQCINCMGAAHEDCVYSEIKWCFICVQNSENVVSVGVRDILLSDDMLTDTVIFKAQELLKKQFPQVMGLGHPIASEKTLSVWSKDEPHKSYAPSVKAASYIQIINTGYDHWITCYKRKGVDNEIYVLNSSGSTEIGSFTEQQLALILNTAASYFKVLYHSVKLQDGTNECGPLAIAFATELAHVGQHMFVDFVTEELRPHLLKCLLAGKLEPFPRQGRSWASQRLKFENVPVHCSCRLPEHFDQRMTKCSQCSILCHWKCNGLLQQPTARRWLCSQCTATKMR